LTEEEPAKIERRQGERRQEERDRARLFEQLIVAEQDERRRLALLLHDGAVQSLSGIALMLDAVGHAIEDGRYEDAQQVLANALERHRQTIQSLRDLSFNLEPVVLRDHGLSSAVAALTQDKGIEHGIQVEIDVAAAELLGERAQAALYQIVREALEGAIRRGPPKTFSVRIAHRRGDDSLEVTIHDDAPGERRRRSIEALEERARTLHATLTFEHPDDGSTMRLVLPVYAGTD
jgi:signal transduction histidine kinase